jgi:hypothetical protein
LAKSMMGSFDNSSLGRQGWKTLMSEPKIWLNRAKGSHKAIWDTWGGKKVADEMMANFVSHPDYQRAKTAKLDIGNVEEAYPVAVPENLTFRGQLIPVVNKLYRPFERAYHGSENAYSYFLHNVRFDTFTKWLDNAEKSGIDINNKEQLQAIGEAVNSLGARGNLGPGLEKGSKIFNNLFFSPRNLKSHIDVLTAGPKYVSGKIMGFGEGQTEFARKEAAKASFKVIAGTALNMMMLNAIGKAINNDDLIGLDPRSASFGKVRIKDTRFDATGGMGSVVVLSARLAHLAGRQIGVFGKDSPDVLYGSGDKKRGVQLNTGEYKGKTALDILSDFTSGKLSPAASVFRDILKGSTYGGEKPTVVGELTGLFIPLPAKNLTETLQEKNAAPTLAVILADAYGISANTYSDQQKKKKIDKNKSIWW